MISINKFVLLGLALCLLSGQALAQSFDIKQAKKIRGGKTSEAAVMIEPNRDYRLDHHQKQGEFDYFTFHLEPNTIVTVETRTLKKGIAWNKTGRVVTTEPWAGVELLDNQEKSILKVEIAGKPETVEKGSLRNRNPKGMPVYLLVGSPHGSLHKDQVAFKITTSPFSYGDLDTDEDTGATPETAMPMMVNRSYDSNSLGGDDSKDLFSFSALKKEWYNVTLRGIDPVPTAFQITVWNRDRKKKLASYVSGGAEQVITKSFKIPSDGQYFVELGLMGRVPERTLYSIEVSKVVSVSQE